MSVVLYLNDFNQPSLTDGCCPSNSWSMSPGVRVAVHDPQITPHMTQAIAVGPGTEMNILMSQFDRIRLPSPYPGNCTTTTQLGDTIDNMGYSSVGCEELCLQDIVSNMLFIYVSLYVGLVTLTMGPLCIITIHKRLKREAFNCAFCHRT